MSRKSPNFRRNKSLPEMMADTRKPKLIADTAWYKVGPSQAYQIVFENGWANVGGSGNPDVQWYVDGEGEKKLIGLVDGGDEGTVIFNLPEEVRPRYKQIYVCAVDGGGTANVGVYPNGDVVLEGYNG